MPLTTNPIRILHPSIDDYQKTVVIRGVIQNDSLNDLKTDFYQRELLPSTSRKNIRNAVETGNRLPDVVLGMRGDNFSMDKQILILLDPVFIIDGQQRIKTIWEMLENCKLTPRLGTVIHLNTTPSWERDLFQKLNQYQVKVSPNIILRNTKEDHPLITTLYGLTHTDKQFVLCDRISWSQNMRRNDLFSALTLLHTTLHLHAHIAPGRSQSLTMAVPNSDLLVKRIGLPTARANIKTFFDLIDSAWGIKRIQIKGGAPYIRRTFLQVLARLVSDHTDFWKGDKEQRLEIGYLIKRKLASFPISDPEIIRLSSASGASRLTLYTHLINHINSGKRVNRLTPRKPVISFTTEELTEDEENEGNVA